MRTRGIHRLSDAAIRNAKPSKRPDGTPIPKLYADGGGLYLRVTPSDGVNFKSWVFRFAGADGREHWMGLGSWGSDKSPTVTLAMARERARERRQEAAEWRDRPADVVSPIEARKAQRAAAAAANATAMTFDECADRYMATHRASWRSAKHAWQWESSLATYVSPVFGKLAVCAVDKALVLKALEKDDLWKKKPETANRVRGRIETVLDWAAGRGHRTGDNPARWKGCLDAVLPARSKVRAVEHHAALPYAEIGAFLAELRKRDGVAGRALEFLILTATRTREVLEARWSEIDPQARVWTVPAEHMKGGREHRVPLVDAAVAVLKGMAKVREGEHVFPGDRRDVLSNMAMLALLERMDRSDLTVHGFRSTFRDWAAECTTFPNHVMEVALAHTIGDAVEAAYRRGDLFEKRRKLMDAWAAYCAKPAASGEVVPMRGRA